MSRTLRLQVSPDSAIMYERTHWFFTLLLLSFNFNLLPLTKCAEINLVGKNATQRTTYETPKGAAVNAVDGNIDGNYDNGHCSHTDAISRTSVAYPWWTVDLVDRYVVQSVTVYNRKGAYRRLQQFNVRVGDNSDPNKQPLCAYYAGEVPDGGSDTINCTPTVAGRYITIQKTSWIHIGILTLCEVKATGYIKECGDKRWDVQSCKACNCKDKSELCKKRTGACDISGCKEGYIGTGCDVAKPRIPDAPVAITVKSRSVELRWRQWRSSDGGQGPVTSYKIQYRIETDSGWSDGGTKTHTVDGQDTTLRVNGLAPGDSYRFRVVPLWRYQGVSTDGIPSPISQTAVNTPCAAPEKPVISSVAVIDKNTDGTLTRIQVTWQKLSALGHHCSRYDRLEVIYSKYSNLGDRRIHTVNTVSDTTATIIPDSGYRSRLYYVAVRVTNNANLYNISDPLTVARQVVPTTTRSLTTSVKSTRKTSSEKPKIPDAPVAITVKSRSVELRWRQWRSSDGGQGPVIAYKIQYRRETTRTWSDGGVKLHTADGQDTVQTVNGLAPGTRYRFRVVPMWQNQGVSMEGTPSPHSASPVNTPCAAPEKPVIRSAKVLDKNTDGIVIKIRVTWQKLSALGHHCISYKQLEVICSYYHDLRRGRIYAVKTVGDTEVSITMNSGQRSRQYYIAMRLINNANFYSTSNIHAVGTQTTGITTAGKRGQSNNPSAGLFAGVGVTVIIIIITAVVVTILVMRHYRRVKRNSPTSQDTRRDNDSEATNSEYVGVHGQFQKQSNERQGEYEASRPKGHDGPGPYDHAEADPNKHIYDEVARDATRQSNMQQGAYEEYRLHTFDGPDSSVLGDTGPNKHVYEQIQNKTYANI